MVGSEGGVNREISSRFRRRQGRGGFRVIPRENEDGEEVWVVVGPSGVALYSFIDVREATAEAAELNSAQA